jgi:hypothetical protein|tara:strand:- start:127 stop:537 length:411 start_codon:yes stop_codon:yes gene_type:complete
MSDNILIKTSNINWLEQAINSYADKVPFDFLDDAQIGITIVDLESAVTLIKKARSSGGVTWQQIVAILTGVGLSSIGVWMIAVAIGSPEPNTKLWLLIGGGFILTLTGGLSILRSLGMKWRVTAQRGDNTITVEPS